MGVLLLAGLLFLMVVPRLDGPHSRQHAHEAVAVGKLTYRHRASEEICSISRRDGIRVRIAPIETRWAASGRSLRSLWFSHNRNMVGV